MGEGFPYTQSTLCQVVVGGGLCRFDNLKLTRKLKSQMMVLFFFSFFFVANGNAELELANFDLYHLLKHLTWDLAAHLRSQLKLPPLHKSIAHLSDDVIPQKCTF